MTQHPEEGTLHAYIDGELAQAEASALEAHIGGCALCAAALAEARGFAAAASRVITTLDAAPSSAVTPAAAVVGVPAAPSKRVVRPPGFRFPYARAAALLLLVGGTAFVFDRAGTPARGGSTQAESVTADAGAGRDLAATAPVEGATAPTTAPLQRPDPTPVGTTLSTGAGNAASSAATGSARRESVASGRPMAATTTDGATRQRAMERTAPATETAPAAFTGRGVAGGIVTKDAAPPAREPSVAAGRDAAPEVARPAVLSAAPPAPARMRSTGLEGAASGALNLVPTVLRYRTREGVVLTLTEEPLRTSFSEESLATQQSASQPGQRRMALATAHPAVNSYRWSSAERGKTFTLSGPLKIAELEALSKKLSELERVP